MRRPSTLLLAATLALVPATNAQGAPLIATVQSGDTDVLQSLVALSAALAVFDANGNGRADANPEEPVYLDLDGSNSVTLNDVRLSGFHRYPAGTVVGVTNRDMTMPLTPVPVAWFGRDPAGAWLVDVDASRTVSAGDLRLAAGSEGQRVLATDPDVGAGLPIVQSTTTPQDRIGLLDRSGNGRFDLGEALYLDLDSSTRRPEQVTPGDARLIPRSYGVDDEPARSDLEAEEAARAAADAELEGRIARETRLLRADMRWEDDQLNATLAGETDARATGDRWLTVLGLLNLAIAAYAIVQVRRAKRGR